MKNFDQFVYDLHNEGPLSGIYDLGKNSIKEYPTGKLFTRCIIWGGKFKNIRFHDCTFMDAVFFETDFENTYCKDCNILRLSLFNSKQPDLIARGHQKDVVITS